MNVLGITHLSNKCGIVIHIVNEGGYCPVFLSEIGIYVATTKYLWMYMSISKKVGDILDKLIHAAILVIRSVHSIRDY